MTLSKFNVTIFNSSIWSQRNAEYLNCAGSHECDLRIDL